MIHILLFILKILGIVLLAALVLVFLILFFPITYTAKFEMGEKKSYGSMTAGWLFHIVHFKGWFLGNDFHYVMRIFGIPFLSSKKKEKKRKSKSQDYSGEEQIKSFDDKKEEMKIDSDNILQERIKKNSYDKINIESEKQKVQERNIDNEDISEKEEITEKTKKFLETIKSFLRKIKVILGSAKNKIREDFQNIEGIYHKLQETYCFIKSESTKEAFAYGKRIIWKLVRHIKPKKIQAKIHYGFETPDVTGRVLGYIAMVYGTFGINPKHIVINPDFENKVLQAKCKCKGYIFLVFVGFYILKFYFKKEIHDLIEKFS